MRDPKGVRRSAVALLTLAGLWSMTGHAEQILLATTPLVQGSLASATPFSVPGAGTVTATLVDLGWPAKLASLTFAATTPTSVLATLPGPGQVSFNTSAPGVYSAVVGAVASPSGFLDLGWYSLTIGFAPSVALPPSAWLLLSGLGALALALRRRGTHAHPVGQVSYARHDAYLEFQPPTP
jgi:hypothetical protein